MDETPSAAALQAVQELREILRLDGADLSIASADGRLAVFHLDLAGATCPDCVLPSDPLEALLLDQLRARITSYNMVRVVDPRLPISDSIADGGGDTSR